MFYVQWSVLRVLAIDCALTARAHALSESRDWGGVVLVNGVGEGMAATRIRS